MLFYLWYVLLYNIYYFYLAMVMFVELCNFIYGYVEMET